MPEEIKGAIIDPTGQFRYSLWRIWNENLPSILFMMLNPSTADETINDPTITRCINFAKAWNYGSLEVVNLFAYRATDPVELRTCDDPIGPENDDYILRALQKHSRVITAWGTNGTLLKRNRYVLELIRPYKPYCLEKTKAGHPKHPLYIAANREPVLFFQEEYKNPSEEVQKDRHIYNYHSTNRKGSCK